VRPAGLLLLGDQGSVALERGIVLSAEDFDPRIDIVPGLLMAADLVLEGGELGAFPVDAGRPDVLVPGELAELAPERGFFSFSFFSLT